MIYRNIIKTLMYENRKENSMFCSFMLFVFFACMQGLYAKGASDSHHGRSNEGKHL